MIDPIQSLAFSMHSNPGVYALLLGSGVSRAAQIPTGWEITLDLIRKLAGTQCESADPDPETWFEENYGEAPNYSKLLDALGKTPTERQQLLRPYFEPNQQEREEGVKQPTAAHRAIAQLVIEGFVKVIITTNFDRLIENALSEAGVVPTVLSAPDQVRGARPLIHTQCCVFKVHGDYLDPHILNTSDELSEYQEPVRRLLGRIFDEFGLIACGWSAEWDIALRNAIFRAPSRRFTTFWALRGEAGDEAQKLIRHRDARVINIADADSFFHTTQQTVQSIQEFSHPHPLSTEVTVARLKRYLSEPRYRIQLSDLIDETAARVVETTSGQDFDVNDPIPDRDSVTSRVRAYESACSTLLSIAAVGGFWAEEEHSVAWGQAVEQLLNFPLAGGRQVWLSLRRYPGMLFLYALGIGALHSDKLRFLSSIFKSRVNSDTGGNNDEHSIVSIVDALGPEARMPWNSLLAGMDRHCVPLSDWIHDALRQPLREVIPNDQKYSMTFDHLEILIALCHFYLKEQNRIRRQADDSLRLDWFPLGAFGYRKENARRILGQIHESIDQQEDLSPYVRSRVFGESRQECKDLLDRLARFISTAARGWGSL